MKVCIIVESRAQFPEMYRTAVALRDEDGVDVSMLFLHALSLEISQAKLMGLEVNVASKRVNSEKDFPSSSIDFKSELSPTKGGFIVNSFKNALKNKPNLFKWLRQNYIKYYVKRTSLIYFPWHVYSIYRMLSDARKIYKSIFADVIVVPFVDVLTISGGIVHVAKQAGKPVIVMPYSWITRKESHVALSQSVDNQAIGFLARFISKLWPHWIYEGLLFAPPVKILALWLLRVPTTNPWMMDSEADFIACESLAMQRSYESDGVLSDKCVVTGSSSLDLLAIQKAKRTFDFLSDFFLVFVPPDQTGNLIPGFDFSNYWEMLVFWVEGCVKMSSKITPIFSIHPRMRGQVEFRLREIWPEIKIYDGDACDLIPHAEFCVSELSGMMRHVLACDKPLLYYDVFKYKFNESDFFISNLFVKACTRQSFVDALEKLAIKSHVMNLKLCNQSNREYWGRLDAGSMERFTTLLWGVYANKIGRERSL